MSTACFRWSKAGCHVDSIAAAWDRGVIGNFPKHHGAAGLRLQWVFDAAKKARLKNCDQRHTASALELGEAAGVASHGSEYLPRYAAYKGYRAGMSCSPDYCSPGLHLSLDAGSQEEAVGVAGGSLGFWLKKENNYPSLLSRNDAEKSQYAPGPHSYRALGAKYWLASLSVIPLDCPWASAVGKEGARCCCRPA
jgi:hypothetical protein